MPLSRASVRILAMATGAAAVGFAALWGWEQRGDAMAHARQSALAEAQYRRLRESALSLDRELRDLRQTVRESSNAVAEISARYREEQATHAPLRRQVEAMAEQQVRDRARVESAVKQAAELQGGAAQARRDLEALRLELTNAVRRAEGLEATVKAKAAGEAAQAAQLAEARKGLAAAQAQTAESEGRLRQATQRVEAAEKELAGLRDAVAKAGADKAAADQAAQKALADKAAAEKAAEQARAAQAVAEQARAAAAEALAKARAELAAKATPPATP